MIDLGFVSAILADQTLDQVLDTASSLGFSCVEIMCWPKGKAERRYAGVTHINVGEYRAADIQKKCRDEKVYISGLGYYPNPLDADEAQSAVFVEHIKRVITAAGELGIGRMNTFVGRDPAKNDDANFARFEKVWPSIIRHAESCDVRVGIENCPMYFTNDEWPSGKNLATCPRNWRRMFEIIPSKNFGLNYDPSHMVLQRMDVLKPMFDFRDRLFHIHIKDLRFYQDRLNEVGFLSPPSAYTQPKLPGLGDVNWGAFISALTEIGYRGPACIEVEDRAYEKSPADVFTALIQSRNYMRQFIPGR